MAKKTKVIEVEEDIDDVDLNDLNDLDLGDIEDDGDEVEEVEEEEEEEEEVVVVKKKKKVVASPAVKVVAKAVAVKAKPAEEGKKTMLKSTAKLADGQVGAGHIAELCGVAPFKIRAFLRANYEALNGGKNCRYSFDEDDDIIQEIVDAYKAKAKIIAANAKKNAARLKAEIEEEEAEKKAIAAAPPKKKILPMRKK